VTISFNKEHFYVNAPVPCYIWWHGLVPGGARFSSLQYRSTLTANAITKFDRTAVDYRCKALLIYCDVVMPDTYLPLCLVSDQHSY
jgi:hypothetical protein